MHNSGNDFIMLHCAREGLRFEKHPEEASDSGFRCLSPEFKIKLPFMGKLCIVLAQFPLL